MEIFAIPGFGVAGISGIVLVVSGLTLSLVDNIVFRFNPMLAINMLLRSLFIVLVSSLLAIILSIWLTKKLAGSPRLKLALNTELETGEGYVGVEKKMQEELAGKKGKAFTKLRPAGKVEIDGEVYDAVAEMGFIDKNTPIVVTRQMHGQIYVMPKE